MPAPGLHGGTSLIGLYEYLAAVRQGLQEQEGFRAAGDLPGSLGAHVPVFLHRPPAGGMGYFDLYVALIPAGGLTHGEQAALLEELAAEVRWRSGQAAAARPPALVAAFVFPEGVEDATLVHLSRLKRYRPGGEAVLPWAVDLPARQVLRHEGPPLLTGLGALEQFPPLLPLAAEPGDVAVVAAAEGPPVPYATYGLLVLIAAAYLWVLAGGSAEDARNLVRHGANDPRRIFWAGEYWRLFTSLFLHGGPMHLLANSLVLVQMGRLVEGLFGRWRFLFIYLVAGLSGNLLSLTYGDFFRPSVGASGAIFGLFGAMVFYRAFSVRGARLPWGGLLWPIAVNLGMGLIIPHVDNWAHVGGLVGGLLAAVVAGLPGPAPRWRLAAAASVLVAAALLLLGLLPVSDRGVTLELGRRALALGRLAQAELLLRAAHDLSPRDWRPHYYLAQVFERQGRRTDALHQARVARDLNPGAAEVQELVRRLEAGP